MNLQEIIKAHNSKYKIRENMDGGSKSVIAIYPGRFQPFSKHHKEVYEWMVKKYGESNSYIVTSNSTSDESPFDFDLKKRIIEASGVPSSNIVKEKSPYAPMNLARRLPNTSAVFVLGEKDANRLKVGVPKRDGSERYFKRFTENADMQDISKSGYVVIAPHVDIQVEGIGSLSGTISRRYMSTMPTSKFGDVLAFSDATLFEEIKNVLDNNVAEVVSRLFNANDVSSLLEYNSTGVSPLTSTEVDDGPRAFVGDMGTYQAQSNTVALKLGYSVVNWILDPNKEFEYHDSTEPPRGAYDPSFFPSGVPDGEDYSSAETQWNKHVTDMAELIGYRIVEFIKTGK